MSTNELRAGAAPVPIPVEDTAGLQRHVPDLLVVILDCSVLGWASVARARSAAASASGAPASAEEMENSAAHALEQALADVLVFLNAHVAMQSDNAVAVYGSVGAEARLLYSTTVGASGVGSVDDEDDDDGDGDENQRRPRDQRERARPDANTFQDFKTLDSQVYFGVRRLIRQAVEKHAHADSATNGLDDGRPHVYNHTGLVPALSQALCLINRLGAGDPASLGAGGSKVGGGGIGASALAAGSGVSAGLGGFRPKILVLSVTGDTSAQYVAMMNCVFAAQKTGVPISVLKLHGPDSVFLQQASYLTGGIYLRVDLARSAAGLACLPQPDGTDGERDSKRRKVNGGTGGLVQVLLSAFLPLPGGSSSTGSSLTGLGGAHAPTSGSGAALLRTPGSDAVDFRAACFCHHQTVSVAYVCSVCLSIFCHPKKRCDTCRSTFPPSTVERLAQQRQLLVDAGLAKDIPVD